jgi:hypothetical protein
MSKSPIELYTSTGGALRKDFSEAEIATLKPDQQAKFFAVIEASNAETDADAELVAAKASLTQAVRDHAAAQVEFFRLNPPTTFLEELRKVQQRPTA